MIYFGECSMCTWKECVFCYFSIECSVYDCYVLYMTAMSIQRHCFLIDFLSRWFVHWCKWSVKVPYVIVLPSISLFMSINICLMYLGAPMYLQVINSFIASISLWLCNALSVCWYGLCFILFLFIFFFYSLIYLLIYIQVS